MWFLRSRDKSPYNETGGKRNTSGVTNAPVPDAAPDPTKLSDEPEHHEPAEHFKPTGTMFILAMFVAALILLWASVYVILLSRGVTV